MDEVLPTGQLCPGNHYSNVHRGDQGQKPCLVESGIQVLEPMKALMELTLLIRCRSRARIVWMAVERKAIREMSQIMSGIITGLHE